MWHQLHSKEYIRLLHWQVPFLSVLWVLLFCKFLIFPDWDIPLQYLQVCGLLHPLEKGVVG